jgi:hypothetical protein
MILYRAAHSPAVLSSLARAGGVCFARRRESAECYLQTSHLGGPSLWEFEVEVEDYLDFRGGLPALAEFFAEEAPELLSGLTAEEAVESWEADASASVWEVIEGLPGAVAALAGRWVRYGEPDVDPHGGPLHTSCDTYRFFGGRCLLGRVAVLS